MIQINNIYKPIMVISIITLAFFSCKKVDELLTFTLRYSENFTVPSVVGVNVPVSLPIPPIETNSDASFKQNNTSAELVKDVKIDFIKIDLISPEGKTFSFLNSIKFYLSSTNNPEELVMESGEIAADVGSSIVLNSIPGNYDKFLKDSEISLNAKVTVDETLLEDVDVKATIKFTVTADPL